MSIGLEGREDHIHEPGTQQQAGREVLENNISTKLGTNTITLPKGRHKPPYKDEEDCKEGADDVDSYREG